MAPISTFHRQGGVEKYYTTLNSVNSSSLCPVFSELGAVILVFISCVLLLWAYKHVKGCMCVSSPKLEGVWA